MTRRQARRRRLRTAVLIVVALVCLVAGTALVVRGLTGSSGAGAPVPEQAFDLDVEEVPDPEYATGSPEQSMADGTVVIPAIGAEGVLVTEGFAADGSLILPTAVDAVTLWDGSAPLDASDGSILIAGHVDDVDQGAGALHELHGVRPGDAVYVRAGGVGTRWKVVALRSVVKSALPDEVFHGPGGPRRLYLVTCGGPIVTDENGRATYLENVIATAVPF